MSPQLAALFRWSIVRAKPNRANQRATVEWFGWIVGRFAGFVRPSFPTFSFSLSLSLSVRCFALPSVLVQLFLSSTLRTFFQLRECRLRIDSIQFKHTLNTHTATHTQPHARTGTPYRRIESNARHVHCDIHREMARRHSSSQKKINTRTGAENKSPSRRAQSTQTKKKCRFPIAPQKQKKTKNEIKNFVLKKKLLYKPIVGDHGVFLGAMPSLFVTSPQRCAVCVHSVLLNCGVFFFLGSSQNFASYASNFAVQFCSIWQRNRRPFAVINSS